MRMKLKPAYPINSTLRSLLPPIPSHNNNQPFRNVNLTIGEIDVRGPGGLLSSNNVFGTINNEDSSVVPVYSLFGGGGEPAAAGNNNNVVGVLNGDAQGRRHHDDRGVEEEGGGEQLLEERADDQNLRFVMNEFGFVELLNGDDDGSGSSSSTTSSSSSSSSESSVVNGVDDEVEDDLSEADASSSSIAMEEEEEDDEDLPGCVQNGVDSSCSSSDEGVLLEQRANNNDNEQRNGAISSNLGNSTISCVTCGCYGLQDEFYDRVHCSYDCEVMSRAGERREMVRRLVEDGVIEEGDEVGVLCFEGMIGGGDGDDDDEGDEEGEEDDEDDEEECEDDEEEDEEEETQLPVKRFKLDDDRGGGGVIVKLENPFRVNDLLEAIDPEHQSLFCPVKVVEIIGYRLLLKFIGYSDKYNFWVNADSEYIFPVNWSTKTIKTLHFHTPDNFTTWEDYIRVNPHYRVAPNTNFKHIEGLLSSSIPGLRVGMKLEAVDVRSGSLLVCVATVSSVMGDKFLVHFDSWDSLYDYWVRFGDQGVVFPVGYCGGRGVEITPPHCYETPSEFNWNEYLKKTNSTPMPDNLFKQTNSTPPKTRTFQLNQQVEVIDKRSPRLLRRAKIISIKNQTVVTVRFNGLDEIYDYDISTDSPDLHEEGWGEATGHPVVSEDDPDVEDLENVEYAVCPNHKVCKSVSSYRNVSVGVHSRLKDCAFFKGNMGGSSSGGGGLFRYTDRVVVFEDKYYDLGGGKGTVVDDDVEEDRGKKDVECMDVDGVEEEVSDTVKTEEVIEKGGSSGNDDDSPVDVVVTDHGLGSAKHEEPPINNNPVVIITPTPTEIKTEGIETKPVSIPNPSTIPTITPIPQPKSKPKPEKEEEELTIPHRSEILTWTNSQISRLVKQICSNLPTCELVASKFCNNLIDGESFLMLTQNDMTDVLGIKLGPAIKIFNVIRIVNSRNK